MSQRLILRNEQSGLQTRIAATEKRFVARADEKLTAFDSRVTREDYLAAFLAKPAKVRIPTGEGDTLNKALKAVAKLSVSELPVIPGIPDAPENLRRVAALH